MELVDGLQLEILVVQLAKDTILINSPVLDDALEIFLQLRQVQLSGICNLDQAEVLVALYDVRCLAIGEESCVREDQGAALELVWVRRYQVVHQPCEGRLLDLIVCFDQSVYWIHHRGSLTTLLLLVIRLAREAVAVKVTVSSMLLEKLVAFGIRAGRQGVVLLTSRVANNALHRGQGLEGDRGAPLHATGVASGATDDIMLLFCGRCHS